MKILHYSLRGEILILVVVLLLRLSDLHVLGYLVFRESRNPYTQRVSRTHTFNV